MDLILTRGIHYINFSLTLNYIFFYLNVGRRLFNLTIKMPHVFTE